MREVDKRYYKINIAGTEHIFTNVYRVGDHYSAYEADKNGNVFTKSSIAKALYPIV